MPECKKEAYIYRTVFLPPTGNQRQTAIEHMGLVTFSDSCNQRQVLVASFKKESPVVGFSIFLSRFQTRNLRRFKTAL